MSTDRTGTDYHGSIAKEVKISEGDRGLTAEDSGGEFCREEVIRHRHNLERESPEAANNQLRYKLAKKFVLQSKTARDKWTDQRSAGGNITGRCSRPVKTAHDEEDYADKRLTTVDNNATAKPVCRKGPENDSQEVAAAARSISHVWQRNQRRWRVAHERMTVPRKGFFRPAREKKSALSAIYSQQN